MAKHKKKHSKKDAVSEGLLDATALSIRKFRKVTTEIGKLSLGQKLVGSAALLLAGYIYLDKFRDEEQESPLAVLGRLTGHAKAEPEEAPKAALPALPAPPHKSRKSPKPSKTHGMGRKPAASPDE